MTRIVGLVLAAGAGTRFGAAGPKPLAPFRGRPLLAWPLAALRDGGLDRLVVVLGAQADAVAAGVDLGDAAIAVCGDWEEGLGASLRCGIADAARRGADAVVVALGDQPLLDGRAVARVVAARAPQDADAVRATYDGEPGHPTVLEASTFAALGDVRGDAGARGLLADPATRVRLVACDGLGRPDDADTPEALARLAAQP